MLCNHMFSFTSLLQTKANKVGERLGRRRGDWFLSRLSKVKFEDREDQHKVYPFIKGPREIVRSRLCNFNVSGLIEGTHNYC